jgi:hypothetical protein
MWRQRIVQVVLLASASLVGVGLVGLFAEWYLRTTVPIDWTQEHRIPHPILGWTLEPGSEYTTYVPEAVRVTYNSEGWRDIEPQSRMNADVRVAVLGDSFVEAYSVAYEEAFSSRFGELAKADGRDIEVFNFGVGGYGTLQEYLVYKQIAPSYRPHLVLLGFYLGNDVRNNDARLESVINAGQGKVESRPFLNPTSSGEWSVSAIDIEGARRRFERERVRRERWPLRDARKSVLLRVIGRTFRRLQDLRPFDGIADNRSTGHFIGADISRFGMHFCQETEQMTSAWKLTSTLLTRLRDDIHANGARLVVFTVPAVEEVEVAAMDIALVDAVDADRICLETAPGYNRLSNMLSSLGIDSVDLLPAFREAARKDNVSLFRREGHWGPAGHALAAEIVFREVQRRLLLSVDGF